MLTMDAESQKPTFDGLLAITDLVQPIMTASEGEAVGSLATKSDGLSHLTKFQAVKNRSAGLYNLEILTVRKMLRRCRMGTT